jgi:hypothetical protein
MAIVALTNSLLWPSMALICYVSAWPDLLCIALYVWQCTVALICIGYGWLMALASSVSCLPDENGLLSVPVVSWPDMSLYVMA